MTDQSLQSALQTQRLVQANTRSLWTPPQEIQKPALLTSEQKARLKAIFPDSISDK